MFLKKEFGSHLHVITSTLTLYALGEDERAEKVLLIIEIVFDSVPAKQ